MNTVMIHVVKLRKKVATGGSSQTLVAGASRSTVVLLT